MSHVMVFLETMAFCSFGLRPQPGSLASIRRANRQFALMKLQGLLDAPLPPLILVSELCSTVIGKDVETLAVFPVAEVWQGLSVGF